MFFHLLFFIFFYLYIWLRIDPRLLYYKNPDLFLLDIDFFKSFILYPGGLSDYISHFFYEFYYFSWLGAFIITLLTFFICLNYSWFLGKVIDKQQVGFVRLSNKALFFIPAFFILIIYNQFQSISLVGISFTLLFTRIYIKLNQKQPLFNILVFIALVAFFSYYFTHSCWLFAGMCAIYEIIKNKKYLLGLLYLAMAALLLFFIFDYIFYLINRNILYTIFSFFTPQNLALRAALLIAAALSLFAVCLKKKSKEGVFCLIVFILVILQFWAEPLSNKIFYSFILFTPVVLILFNRPKLAIIRGYAQKYNNFLFILFLFSLLLIITFNEDANIFLRINYFSQNKDYEAVLSQAKKAPEELYLKEKSLYQMVFNALYFAGRLPYEQFNYPAFLAYNMPVPQLNPKLIYYLSPDEISDTCFNLGLINHSEFMSYWALETGKEPVRAIKQCVLIYMVHSNKEAARVMLNRLKKSMLYREWAKRYLMFLDNPELLEKDPYLIQVKARMIKRYEPGDDGLLIRLARGEYDYEAVYKRLLEEDKNNKMAFEYLMAYYLLEGETEKIVDNIWRLEKFGYAGIPYNYQEAILINMYKTGNINHGLGGRKINPELIEKYNHFDEVFRNNKYDRLATYTALKDKHKNSYFLYYIRLVRSREDNDSKD